MKKNQPGNKDNTTVPLDENGVKMIYNVAQRKYVRDILAGQENPLQQDARQAVVDHNNPVPKQSKEYSGQGRIINGLRYRF